MATIPDFLKNQPVHEALNSVSWLAGRWISENGSGQFPTISPFTYCEQIEFRSLGRAFLQYETTSWHPEKKNALHIESGFLRVKPGTNEVSFLLAYGSGLTSVEEGHVIDKTISLKSTNISRDFSSLKDTRATAVQRNFSLKEDQLEQLVYMETNKTPLTEHLRIVYNKVA